MRRAPLRFADDLGAIAIGNDGGDGSDFADAFGFADVPSDIAYAVANG